MNDMNNEILLSAAKEFGTPSFIFDTDEFERKADAIKNALGNIPLCYSIKANPFLLHKLPESLSMVEVCSPGELAICRKLGIKPETIIYSGVNKGAEDIACAVDCGAGILTAESRLHAELINRICLEKGKRARVILRLTSGNQFGMDPEDIVGIISEREKYEAVDFIGLHYYSGTQKKNAGVIEKDIGKLEEFIERLNSECGYVPSHVEYGPGMAADYFVPPYEEKDCEMLRETAEILNSFAKKYPLSVEMGRFLASSCGTYLTSVADIKNNLGTNYVICDGGINHLKYYGQTMAMQVPPVTLLGSDEPYENGYTLCGSLCTTADLLVRRVELPKLKIGDVLAFGRCGAYTVTEGTVLFLSRTMPRIMLYSEKDGIRLVRDFYDTYNLNC